MKKSLIFEDKCVLITGGTGTLGKVLLKRILQKSHGNPNKVIVFSRDEAKQYFLRQSYQKLKNTDDGLYQQFVSKVQFIIGDIRDFFSVQKAIKDCDIVIHAAAMKQVPSCEYFPFEAVQTNIIGAENIIRAINTTPNHVNLVLGISTDKACNPVSAMGMTKALQEKLFISANIQNPKTKFICVRYGNLLISRGSVVPMFVDQIKNGGPVTVTSLEMTRFLLPVEKAVDAVIFALNNAQKGEIVVPDLPSAYLVDVAKSLIADLDIELKITEIRPGEKNNEFMISEQEAPRTYYRNSYFFIRPTLPELIEPMPEIQYLQETFHSANHPMDLIALSDFLIENGIFVESDLFLITEK
ncbi:MAG: polysaccharide biosynthesis protein [Bacteroidota bacterium]|nr:polysaccharide biosynthesis protein [Bacteroidota bacterium]